MAVSLRGLVQRNGTSLVFGSRTSSKLISVTLTLPWRPFLYEKQNMRISLQQYVFYKHLLVFVKKFTLRASRERDIVSLFHICPMEGAHSMH